MVRAATVLALSIITAQVHPIPKPVHKAPTDPKMVQLIAVMNALLDASREFGVDPMLAFSVAWNESRLKPRAVARRWREVGGKSVLIITARGLMQINPAYQSELVAKHLPGMHPDNFQWDNPIHSARLGCAYLRYLIDRVGTWGGVCSYNCGLGRFYELVKHGRQLPAETVEYYGRVMG